MRKDLRKNKDGSSYYSFLYYDKDAGKRVRLSKEYIRRRFGRDLTTAKEAEDALKILCAENESLQVRLEKRTNWEKQYYNFSGLLQRYIDRQKRKAPNSYENNIHYLRHYVLHFFLTVERCNNIDLWPDLYEKFRDWLETKAFLIKQPEKLISYGAKNHCIKALNTFMSQLHQEKIIYKLIRCEKFPTHLLNERSIDDVIFTDEMLKIVNQLSISGNSLEAKFFRMLYFTGFRFNEGLGLSLQDLYPGRPEHKTLRSLLDKHDIPSYGYIVLSSQPSHETRGLRNNVGEISRKPLKGRKKISEKHSRVVVITDKQLWTELKQLFNRLVDLLDQRKWGDNPSNYALFEGIDKTTSTRRLQQAYKKLGLRYRSWHCCRHSCTTNLIGETGDYYLARLWLGHNSPNVIERYAHIHQAIVRDSQKRREGTKGGIRKLET